MGGGGWQTFKTEFNIPSDAISISATLLTFVDNAEKIYINGTYLGDRIFNFYGQNFTSGGWWKVENVPYLVPGKNVIEFICFDEGGSGVGKLFDLTVNYATNTAPTVSVQQNAFVNSSDVVSTTIYATASDIDGDAVTYRWLEGGTELKSWAPIGTAGESNLLLSEIQELSVGIHTLTIEVTDGFTAVTADTILTVGNTPPIVAINGGAVIQVGTSASLSGSASDYDGDSLTYSWLVGGSIVETGQIDSTKGGAPISVPSVMLSGLSIGNHDVTLEISDGINTTVSDKAVVEVVDTEAPILAPTASTNILWPPNHELVDVIINVNATDNGGGSLFLDASVNSSELVDSTGDGSTNPDVVGPVVDQEAGTITLQLRAERAGKGKGRIYTVVIMATDESGNTSQTSIEIKAPHDLGGQK